MRIIALLALLLIGLAGCASRSITPYGNFSGAPAELAEKMAGDAVKQLVTLYPPAHTRFNLGQATPDAFGAILVKTLRDKGYALLELKSETPGRAANQSISPGVGSVQEAAGVDLRYVLDKLGGANLYRVTMTVGNQSLTRAYLAQNNTVTPAGSWVRKE